MDEPGQPAFFTLLHERIKARLEETFQPAVDTIAIYWPFDKPSPDGDQWEIDTPAILLEVETADLRDGPGDGRKAVALNLALHCLLSTKTPNVEVEVRNFALAVSMLIHEYRWGFACDDAEPPEDIAAVPSTLVLDKPGFEAWSVVWGQVFYIGEMAWNASGLVPETICFSFAPRIGAAHEADYKPLSNV